MKINYRQMSILLFMSFISLKFLVLPSLMYTQAGNMSWFVAFVLMIIDGLYALMIVGIMQKNKSTSIFDFMRQTLGPVLSKIITAVLMIRFAIVISNISKGMEFFVIENFYTELNWFIFVMPLVVLVGFMAYKGIRNIARVTELLFIPVIIGCLYIALKSIINVDILSFLPFFKDGFMPIVNAGYEYICWFGSSTFILLLFGRVDFKKCKKRNLFFAIIGGILLTMLIYFVFYGLFDTTSPTHNFAISDISQFSTERISIDELSWLIVALWVVAQAVQLAMYGYCMAECVKELFNIKSEALPIIVVDLYIFGWSYIGEKTIELEAFFFTDFVQITMLITQYLIPLIILLAHLVNQRKKKRLKNMEVKYEKVKNHI
ncbi:MAG: GerAB/ArcD/ProY family transporter [Clostridia bacterium]|nr:GerAB/ArcD/ProY family transporter [Clostridia bacterium]